MWRRILAAFAVIPMILLAACSQLGRVGVSSADDGRGIMMHFARCSPDAPVKSARLRALGDPANSADDAILWEVRSEVGAPLGAITVGVVPAGFEQTVALAEIPLDQRIVIDAYPDLGSESFLLQDLQPDVYWNGEFLSPAAFREQVDKRGLCGNSAVSFSGLRSFFVVLFTSVGVVLTVAAGGAILIWRRRQRAPVDF